MHQVDIQWVLNRLLLIQDGMIEGLGEGEDAYWDDYPINTLLIRNETRTVYDVLRRIEKGSFVMAPDFKGISFGLKKSRAN